MGCWCVAAREVWVPAVLVMLGKWRPSMVMTTVKGRLVPLVDRFALEVTFSVESSISARYTLLAHRFPCPVRRISIPPLKGVVIGPPMTWMFFTIPWMIIAVDVKPVWRWSL